MITLSSSYCAAFLKRKIIQDSAEYLREQALTKAYQTTEQSEGEVKKAYYINLATTDILTIETGISSVFVLIGSIMAAISSSIALFYYSY